MVPVASGNVLFPLMCSFIENYFPNVVVFCLRSPEKLKMQCSKQNFNPLVVLYVKDQTKLLILLEMNEVLRRQFKPYCACLIFLSYLVPGRSDIQHNASIYFLKKMRGISLYFANFWAVQCTIYHRFPKYENPPPPTHICL